MAQVGVNGFVGDMARIKKEVYGEVWFQDETSGPRILIPVGIHDFLDLDVNDGEGPFAIDLQINVRIEPLNEEDVEFGTIEMLESGEGINTAEALRIVTADPTTLRGWLKRAIALASKRMLNEEDQAASWRRFAENAQKALADSELRKDEEMARIAEMAEEFEQTKA